MCGNALKRLPLKKYSIKEWKRLMRLIQKKKNQQQQQLFDK